MAEPTEKTSDYAPYFPEPTVQNKETEERERSDTVASLPVIQDVLDWFDEQIAEFKDPTRMSDVSVTTDAETLKAQVLLNQSQAKAYEEKRDAFTNRFSQHIKDVADAA